VVAREDEQGANIWWALRRFGPGTRAQPPRRCGSFLRTFLPEYMVSGNIRAARKSLPLGSTLGKVDRQALPFLIAEKPCAMEVF